MSTRQSENAIDRRTRGYLISSVSGASEVPWSGMQWVLGIVSVAFLLLVILGQSRSPQMDFDVYRMGGSHVLGGGLYDAHTTILGRRLLFTYSPFAALLFWPVSHLSIQTGQAIWDVLDVVGLISLLAVSVTAARGKSLGIREWRLAAMLATPAGVMLYPLRSNLELGQINVFLVLMIVVDLTMTISLRSHRLPQGVLIGLASAIKLTPIVFIPYLLLTRQYRAARNASLTFVGAIGAMFAIAPGASWAYWHKDAFDLKRVGKTLSLSNQSLHAVIGRAHLSTSGVMIDLCLLVVLCGGLAVAVLAYHKSSLLLGLLVCAATGLLVSPVSWLHHFVWIVPVLTWLGFSTDRPKHPEWWVVAVAIVFIVPPDITRDLGLLGDDYVMAAVAFIILVGCMVWLRGRRSLISSLQVESSVVVGEHSGA